MFKNFIAIALGGALGACLRYAAVLLSQTIDFSGTITIFLVNIIGSFVLGIITGTCSSGTFQLFLSMGLCGAFTTFSTYSVRSVTLIQEGKIGEAFLYIVGSVIICVLFAWIGIILGSKLMK